MQASSVLSQCSENVRRLCCYHSLLRQDKGQCCGKGQGGQHTEAQLPLKPVVPLQKKNVHRRKFNRQCFSVQVIGVLGTLKNLICTCKMCTAALTYQCTMSSMVPGTSNDDSACYKHGHRECHQGQRRFSILLDCVESIQKVYSAIIFVTARANISRNKLCPLTKFLSGT